MNCTTCRTHLGTWKIINFKGTNHYQHTCGHVYGLYTTRTRGKMNVSRRGSHIDQEEATRPRRITVRYQRRGQSFRFVRRLIDRLSYAMKLYVLTIITLPLLAFAQPVSDQYLTYVAQTEAALASSTLLATPPAEAQISLKASSTSKTEESSVEDQIKFYAQKYAIDPDKYFALVSCENKELDPNAQSNLTYKFSDPSRGIKKGQREQSYGLLQIHSPDHQDITIAQMTSADFSLDWGAREIAAGHAWNWKICGARAGF